MQNASIFIGSDLNAVHTTSSKLITGNILENANICTPKTKLLKDVVPDSKSGWIIKPDDGVGAENCIYVSDSLALREIVEFSYLIMTLLNILSIHRLKKYFQNSSENLIYAG